MPITPVWSFPHSFLFNTEKEAKEWIEKQENEYILKEMSNGFWKATTKSRTHVQK